jgi:hypothetical protein
MKPSQRGTFACPSVFVLSRRRPFQTLRLQTPRKKSTMNIGTETTSNKTWGELYRAALFEIDKEKRSQLIADARRALLWRARELFYADKEHFEERQAVNAAIYALHVFQSSVLAAEERTTTRSRSSVRAAQARL